MRNLARRMVKAVRETIETGCQLGTLAGLALTV